MKQSNHKIHNKVDRDQYLGTQYFVNCISLFSLSRILGHIEP